MSKLLFKCDDNWTEAILKRAWEEIERVAREELKADYYEPEIQIVSAKQMLNSYTSVGMPIYYNHWSFGKEFVNSEKAYKKGHMNLAYELVINSDPCVAYLMEENDALIQTLVMAHASVGHSAVFKNNFLFKDKTDATAIVDYLSFAKKYVKMCEEKYGAAEVEVVIDACHAIMRYGVDKYKKPRKLSPAQEETRALQKFEQELQDYDHVWEKIGKRRKPEQAKRDESYMLSDPEENLLYFLEKQAPHLAGWKREIIRIVRTIAQYFSPQRPTQVVNEGYATFCHYYIINRLHDKGLIDGGSMIEFFSVHNNVVAQRRLSWFNPYKLGFSIFMDIKRMCESPTDEDRLYFPDLVGQNWIEQVNYAMANFKDETFILQYLSPKVARDLRMFAFNDPSLYSPVLTVTEISNERSFRELRAKLAAQYAVENQTPDIQITGVDSKGSRKLLLEHFVKRNARPLNLQDAKKVVKYVADLWEYSVSLKTINYTDEGDLETVNISELGKYSRSLAGA